MDAVSYPDPKVITLFAQHLVPVRVLINSKPLPQQFRVKWTPTLLVLDAEGDEHHRSVGFLPPDELMPSLLLGVAKSHFDKEEFDQAIALLDQVLADYPESDVAPEAMYYRGVSRYKSTNDAAALKRVGEEIAARYPDSEWAKRSSVYELL